MEELADGPRTRITRTDALVALLVTAAALLPLAPGLRRFALLREGEGARLRAALFDGVPHAPLFRPVQLPEGRVPGAGGAVASSPEGAAGPDAASPSDSPGAGAQPRRPAVPEGADSSTGATPGRRVEIEDPGGELARFFERLDAARRGEAGAVVRVTHFGDSPVTGDLISGEARRRMQAAFGDAGHGFLLVAPPWSWYRHDGVALDAAGWKAAGPLVGGEAPGASGLAGIAFSADGKGDARARAETTVSFPEPFTHVTLFFLRRAAGGRVLLSAGGPAPVEVATSATSAVPAGSPDSAEVTFPAGSRRLEVRTAGDGPVTLHGLAVEGDGPGVVWDAVGANGASVHHLSLLEGRAWEASLARRRSDLLVFAFGTNESETWGVPGPRYEREYEETIARARRALPSASILVLAPMDRGTTDGSGGIVTWPTIPGIVAAQRRVAARTGAAFFDTFEAMGGEGTMGRWYASEPRLVAGDLTHPSRTGANRVGRLLVGALDRAYGKWLEETAAQPSGGPPAPAEVPAAHAP